MNVSLERLIEGIIGTLRSDVIPHVSDPYARGQAVGVIDLLNNIGTRIEWARGGLLDAVKARRTAIAAVQSLVPELGSDPLTDDLGSCSTADIEAERDRLDAVISGMIETLGGRATGAGAEALSILKTHMHEELTREMALTKKPLFAEIASGKT